MYFDLIGGIAKFKLNDFDFGVSISDRKKYYPDINTIFSNNQISHKDAVISMNNTFRELYNLCFKSINNSGIGMASKTSSDAYVTMNQYNNHGYLFDFTIWSNPWQINSYFNEVYHYDIYYTNNASTNKNEFKLIAKGQYFPRIDKTIIFNPTGRYFLRGYVVNKPTEYVDSDIISLSIEGENISDRYSYFYDSYLRISDESRTNLVDQLSNYLPQNSNWYNERIRLSLSVNAGTVNLLNYDVIQELYYINKSSGEKKVLETKSFVFGGANLQYSLLLKPNNQTHGIYYIKTIIRDKSNGNVVNVQYSKNSYIFTKSDVENFNIKEWNELSKKIS